MFGLAFLMNSILGYLTKFLSAEWLKYAQWFGWNQQSSVMTKVQVQTDSYCSTEKRKRKFGAGT